MSIKRILIALVLAANLLAYSAEETIAKNQEATVLNRDSLVISDFEVTGNKNVDISEILSQFNIKSGDEFDKSKIEGLLNAIVSSGYFESAKPITKVNPENKSVKIEIKLIENKIIKKLTIDGINSIDKNKLLEKIGLKVGSVFNYNYVDREKSPILLALRENGIYMPVILSVNMTKDNELKIKVSEGKVSKIEFLKQSEKKDNVKLDSSDFKLKTNDFVLTRNLEIKKDEYLTLPGLKATVENLLRTGLFEAVEPRIEIDPQDAEKRVVVFIITERRTASINGSGSYSTSAGFVASASLKDENFLGGHHTASVSASVGTTGSVDVRLSYLNPWIRGTNNILAGADLYYKRIKVPDKSIRNSIDYERDKNTKINGILAEYITPSSSNEFGLSTTVGKLIYKNLYLNVNPGISYEFSKTTHGLTLTDSVRGYTNISLNYSDVDNPALPKKGNRVRATVEGVYVFKDSGINGKGEQEAKKVLYDKQKKLYECLTKQVKCKKSKEEELKKYFEGYEKDKDKDGDCTYLSTLNLTTEGQKWVLEKLKSEKSSSNDWFKTEFIDKLKNGQYTNKSRFFTKFEFEYVNYTPLLKDINVLASRFFLGKATAGADKSALFPVKGNGTFLRGYETADLTNFIIAGNIENRFYLNKYLGGVIFLDSGIYANRESEEKIERMVDVFKNIPTKLKISVGGGIRINTPIGLLRLDYGVPLLNNQNEGRGKIEFGLSESF